LRGYYPNKESFEWMRKQGFRYHTMAEIERRGWPDVMEDIIREAKDGRPMLSSVVVHKGTTTVDPGFYQLGQDMHQVQPGETDEAFGKRQQDETFAFWSTHPEAGPLE
jgi:hypothetical protein